MSNLLYVLPGRRGNSLYKVGAVMAAVVGVGFVVAAVAAALWLLSCN